MGEEHDDGCRCKDLERIEGNFYDRLGKDGAGQTNHLYFSELRRDDWGF